jgi:hypothetical protein
MLAEKELATVGRMADGRLFVSRVDLLHAYVHALAIARQVKEYLGGTTNTGTADGDTSSNLSFSPRLVEDLFNAISTLQQIRDTHPDVCIAAITNGRGSPLHMSNTLEPFFDFLCQWRR